MDAAVLKVFGQIAGIGGLSLGVFLLLFREIIRKNIFPRLPAQEAYKLLRLITGAVWSVAIVGIAAWVYVGTSGGSVVVGRGSIGVGGNVSGSDIRVESPSLPASTEGPATSSQDVPRQ